MSFYIITFLILVAGTLAGLLTGLLVFKPRVKETEFVKCEYRKDAHPTDPYIDITDDVSDAEYVPAPGKKEIREIKPSRDEVPGVDLKARIAKRQESNMVDFNCAADSVDKKEYIKERQSKEDSRSFGLLKDRMRKEKPEK